MKQDNDNEWAEPLPENCPPESSLEPNNEIYYRLVDKLPPVETDFYSAKRLTPDRKFRVSECISRALSIHSSLLKCLEMKKFPLCKLKIPIKISLPPRSGVIIQSKIESTHYSWWLKGNFDPIPLCQSIED